METIKIIKVACQYLLRSQYAGYNSWYEFDGTEFKEAQDIVFETCPEYCWKYTKTSKLDHYENEFGQNLSPEIYKEKVAEIVKDCACADEPTFESLEQEYAYKKFIQEWKPVYIDVVSKAPIKLDIQEYGDSRNKYIVSHRFVGMDISKCLYQYQPNSSQMAREIAKKYEFEEVEDRAWGQTETKGFKFSIPSHSGIKYMKVNGSYVINDELKLHSISAGTLTECEDAFQKDYKAIEKIFLTQRALILTSDYDAQSFYADLISLENRIRSIDYKQNGKFAHRNSLNLVEEMKEKLLKVKNSEKEISITGRA